MAWKSVIQEKPTECFLCGGRAEHKHHCMHGSNRREKAEEDGLYCMLCVKCHDDIHFSIHTNLKDIHLRRIAQEVYEEEHTHQEYMERYGKNYL